MRGETAETAGAAWQELAWGNYFSNYAFYIPKVEIKVKEKIVLSNFE